MLPVENLGIPTVWIDQDAYRQQRHKQCAFNLYAAAMLRHALAPVADSFGDAERATRYRQMGDKLREATVRRFWSHEEGLFIDNLPWLAEEGQPRPAIVRWRPPFCLISALTDVSRRRLTNWLAVRAAWASRIPATRAGGCGAGQNGPRRHGVERPADKVGHDAVG